MFFFLCCVLLEQAVLALLLMLLLVSFIASFSWQLFVFNLQSVMRVYHPFILQVWYSEKQNQKVSFQ